MVGRVTDCRMYREKRGTGMGTNDTFEIFKDAAGQYRWQLKASNGEIVATSEAYVSRQDAVASAHKLHEWASNTPVKNVT
jgi:uncharacterized protein YegP (UPF0339 family)